MKQLLKRIAGRFGYEIRRIDAPSPAIVQFLKAAESEPQFNIEPESCARTANASELPSQQSDQEGVRKSLIVEGWRSLPHSYAIVNEWQLLALRQRANFGIKVADVPLYQRRWQTREGLFDSTRQQVLSSIPSAEPDEAGDVTLRIFFPFDFSTSRSHRTAVFGTLEIQRILRAQVIDFRLFDAFQRGKAPADLTVITPSRWSAEGFYKAGFQSQQVLVVPHGVDVSIFRPMRQLCSEVRKVLSIDDGDFVFLSIGAMTGNKGMDTLLRAFAVILQKYPHARLVLKGMDSLYNSRNFLRKILERLPAYDQQRVVDRTLYFGNSIPHAKLALLYQAADAYVAPYRAEGFNIPVLEAAACGIPIICTRGGPTDDFVTDAFARRIESKQVSVQVEDQYGSQLQPHFDHLVALMTEMIEDGAWRKAASEAGPPHVRAAYTWNHVADRLIDYVINGSVWDRMPATINADLPEEGARRVGTASA